MNLAEETNFFHKISRKVLELVANYEGKPGVSKYKDTVGDYATEIDLTTEKLIVQEIKACFPNDAILAEEEYSDTAIGKNRIWIIDPICGTANLGRGINAFCTNIALAENRKLIAACVIDHSVREYIWSVGNNEVFIGNILHKKPINNEQFGVIVDVDLSAAMSVNVTERQKLSNAVHQILSTEGYAAQSLNTSLGFAYTAISKLDGFINVVGKPWDICAAAYLIEQAGGIITDRAGNPWSVDSVGAIAALDPKIHQKLLSFYNQ